MFLQCNKFLLCKHLSYNFVAVVTFFLQLLLFSYTPYICITVAETFTTTQFSYTATYFLQFNIFLKLFIFLRVK